MNKITKYYYDQLIRAIFDVDIDIDDGASVEEIADACHNFAFVETIDRYSDSSQLDLVDDDGTVIELIEYSYQLKEGIDKDATLEKFYSNIRYPS